MVGWSRPEFDWDEANEEHIERHDVYPDEVEHVFATRPVIRRGKGVYYIYGRDDAGRYLFVVVIRRAGRVRVVTARHMEPDERKFYDRHKKP
jgi:uncharacterized protein